MLAILDFSKRLYISPWKSYIAQIQNWSYLPLKYIIKTYFDTNLSMIGLTFAPTEEGAYGPQNGVEPGGLPALHRS